MRHAWLSSVWAIAVMVCPPIFAGGPGGELPPDVSQRVAESAIQSSVQVAANSGASEIDILKELLMAIIKHIGVLPSLFILLGAAAIIALTPLVIAWKKITENHKRRNHDDRTVE